MSTCERDAVLGVADVTAAHRVRIFDAAQDGVVALLWFEDEVAALTMVVAEVADPVLTKDLFAKAESPRIRVTFEAFVVFGELAVEILERMRRGAHPDHWFAGVQVVLDVLHLIIGEVLEAQEDHHQVSCLQCFESGDVVATRFDKSRLLVGCHQERALEAVPFSEDASERRQGFFATILVVAGDEDDVFALARTSVTLPYDGVGVCGCRERWAKRVSPFLVAGLVGVQEVWELCFLRIAVGVRKDRIRVEHGDLRDVLDGCNAQFVNALDVLRWTSHASRAWEDLAQEDRHLRIVFGESHNDRSHVVSDGFRTVAFFEVVGAHQHDDATWINSEYVIFDAYQHAAGRVATDAAVGYFDVRETAAHGGAPALRDRVTEEDDGALVTLGFVVPLGALGAP